MKKRLISLLLAVAMMLAVMPVSVFAEGENTVPLHINSDGQARMLRKSCQQKIVTIMMSTLATAGGMFTQVKHIAACP